MCANPTPSTSALVFAENAMPSFDPAPTTIDVDGDIMCDSDPTRLLDDNVETAAFIAKTQNRSASPRKSMTSAHDLRRTTSNGVPKVEVNGRRASALSRGLVDAHRTPPPVFAPSADDLTTLHVDRRPLSNRARLFTSLNSLRHVSSESSTARLIEEEKSEATRRSRVTSEGDRSTAVLHDVATFAEFDQSRRVPRVGGADTSSVRRFYKHQDSLRQQFIDDERMIEQYLKQKKVVAEVRARMLSSTQSNTTDGVIKEVDADDHDDDVTSASSGLVVAPYMDTVETTTTALSGPVENEDYTYVENEASRRRKKVRSLSQLSFVVNIFLLGIKIVAVVMTGSYAIISSLVDSCVDLTSGSVIWYTERAIRKRDPYQYPRGRTRLEPLALVIISVVMAVASIQVIVQSMDACASGDFMPNVRFVPIVLMAMTVALKLALFFVCRAQNRQLQDASVAVLAQDHGNDCVSNTVAIACAYAGAHLWKYIDPIGAIVVSCYIAYTWFSTGYEQIRMLTGQSAPATFINRIINIATKHDVRIRSIDTVYCYHFGTRFLVEVHIVMDAEMSLRDSHDIGESLQCKLESLAYVERAFVHADYECEHRPEDEHTVV